MTDSSTEWLSNLACAQLRLFERTGDSSLLEEAAEAARAAVDAAPARHRSRAMYLGNLGIILLYISERTGSAEALAEAAEAEWAALGCLPAKHPDQAKVLSNVATIQTRRYQRTGRVRSLRRAIRALRATVAITPADHPNRGIYLNNLGEAMRLLSSLTRCDALIVDDAPADAPDQAVRAVPLPGLTQESVQQQVSRLTDAQRRIASGDPAALASAQADTLTILEWMWDTIGEPVMDTLGYHKTPEDDGNWPRIWWCPVGVVAYLPLHAAGRHGNATDENAERNSRPRAVMDLVVSSNAPTLRGLAYARTQDPGPGRKEAVIVAAPKIYGFSSLPGARAEASILSALIPGAELIAEPTRAEILGVLSEYLIAHFACHGSTDLSDPAASHLVLSDHATAPLTVADISALKLSAGLAYLSACETTVTSPALTDEAIHITGAFHLAGYQHVIGTLWPVLDSVAARLAAEFYSQLTSDGAAPPDISSAARVLHHAIRRLRDRRPAIPTAWAPYTHTGI